ncbi:uncharacterized protein LOC122369240 isoform X1 [Amphibalanus amphitrite]|uniref:uncharacterized protein LOC122369240 isoform X1 n=1 Tax=Amphibalanus amphitrite TaxID=1232801 RepID=UPI001C90C270|nr:uncharacterized protein LOC122369240 isoform X1 [Amphibalanus amphitrite]
MATCTDWPSRDWYVPPVTTCTDWQSKEWTEAAGGLGHAMGFDSQSASELSGVSCEESPSSDLQARSDAATERCLRRRIDAGDKRAVLFLAQLYFDRGDYESARPLFASIAAENVFAQYQLGVMLFEGLGFEQDLERGFRLMLMVALSVPKTAEQKEAIHRAQYNIARAYFMGYGVHSSEDDGRRWLDRAVDGGSRLGSARAQTMLAMLLARSDTRDLPKSFFWHSEATGNGSLESQGGPAGQHLRHGAARAALLPPPLLSARGALFGAPGAVRRRRCGPVSSSVGLSGSLRAPRPGHRLLPAVALPAARPGLPGGGRGSGSPARCASRGTGPGRHSLGGAADHARLLAAVARTVTGPGLYPDLGRCQTVKLPYLEPDPDKEVTRTDPERTRTGCFLGVASSGLSWPPFASWPKFLSLPESPECLPGLVRFLCITTLLNV